MKKEEASRISESHELLIMVLESLKQFQDDPGYFDRTDCDAMIRYVAFLITGSTLTAKTKFHRRNTLDRFNRLIDMYSGKRDYHKKQLDWINS